MTDWRSHAPWRSHFLCFSCSVALRFSIFATPLRRECLFCSWSSRFAGISIYTITCMKTDMMRTRLYQAERYERTLARNINTSRHVAIVSVGPRHIVSMVSSVAETYFWVICTDRVRLLFVKYACRFAWKHCRRWESQSHNTWAAQSKLQSFVFSKTSIEHRYAT